MGLGAAAGALGLVSGATPSTRLPTDAQLDPGMATAIAADPVRRAAAHAYWAARFAALLEDPFGAADTPALELGRALSALDLDLLHPDRAHLTNAVDAVSMVKPAGCLVSLDEISDSIEAGGFAARLIADLQAFAVAATGPADAVVDVAQVARGVRGAREVFDAARRLAILQGTVLTRPHGLDEAFALFRQEGALAITPPQLSFRHAPLIATAGGTCRRPFVSLGMLDGERPGFSFVHRRDLHVLTRDNDTSKRFDALVRNLLVTGGIDSLVVPQLPAGDELAAFHAAAKVPGRDPAMEHLRTAVRAQLSSGGPIAQTLVLDEHVRGLMMATLDGRPAPDAATLLAEVDATLTDELATHPIEQRSRGGGKDIHLLGDDDGSGTAAVLDLQAEWYGSRSRLDTLVARKDRSAALAAAPRLSPYLTYLRFHAGDQLFMGVLLRALGRLEALRTTWAANAAWGTRLPDALAASSFDPAEAAALGALAASHWRTKVGSKTVWRHIGLLAELAAAGPAPAWLPAARPVGATLTTTADTALRAVTAIVDQDLLDVLDAALQFTPVTNLVAAGVLTLGADPRMIAAKAHSFERMRLTYAEAIATAGI